MQSLGTVANLKFKLCCIENQSYGWLVLSNKRSYLLYLHASFVNM